MVGLDIYSISDWRPEFDLGTLNRKLVFSVFRQVGAQYYDLAGRLGINSARDARLNPALLVAELRQIAFKAKQYVEGPIAFLLDERQADDAYETSLLRHLELASRERMGGISGATGNSRASLRYGP